MWRTLPLDYVILEVLKKKNPGTVLTEKELYDEVVKAAGYEVPYSDFLKALMKLEIHGYINVFTVKEDFRHITYLGQKDNTGEE
jgi:DNA-binding PadR family transcriptional regulator